MKGKIPENREELEAVLLARLGEPVKEQWDSDKWNVEDASRERAYWLVAVQEARNIQNAYSTKDLAEAIQHGIGPVNDEFVTTWLQELWEPYLSYDPEVRLESEGLEEAESNWEDILANQFGDGDEDGEDDY